MKVVAGALTAGALAVAWLAPYLALAALYFLVRCRRRIAGARS